MPDKKQDSITCPECDKTSHNKGDIKNEYCGSCKMYHADMAITLAMKAQEYKPDWLK
jgi:ribosomal protein L37AE/L43A